MINWRERHLDIIRKEKREVLLEGAVQDQFIAGCRAKKWPVGSIFLWSIGVCGPAGSASKRQAE